MVILNFPPSSSNTITFHFMLFQGLYPNFFSSLPSIHRSHHEIFIFFNLYQFSLLQGIHCQLIFTIDHGVSNIIRGYSHFSSLYFQSSACEKSTFNDKSGGKILFMLHHIFRMEFVCWFSQFKKLLPSHVLSVFSKASNHTKILFKLLYSFVHVVFSSITLLSQRNFFISTEFLCIVVVSSVSMSSIELQTIIVSSG